MSRQRVTGFTLAELLIALSILGIIAVFTAPKLLQTQQNTQQAAIGKEVAASIVGAYYSYLSRNPLTSGVMPRHLTPYLNYVANDTAATVRHVYRKHGQLQLSRLLSAPA
jgi:prepilin-type N-terminal cleavage/methylation domain-containing protein